MLTKRRIIRIPLAVLAGGIVAKGPMVVHEADRIKFAQAIELVVEKESSEELDHYEGTELIVAPWGDYYTAAEPSDEPSGPTRLLEDGSHIAVPGLDKAVEEDRRSDGRATRKHWGHVLEGTEGI